MKPHDIEPLLKYIDGRPCVVSVSGGKDSAACSLYLTEMGIEHTRVFADTGWEHPVTYWYVMPTLEDARAAILRVGDLDEKRTDEVLADIVEKYGERSDLRDRVGDVSVVRSEFTMAEIIRKKGMFPARLRRYCTETLKIKPIKGFLNAMDAEPINVVGIRHEESVARSKMPEWEESAGFKCEVWRPLVDWRLQDVIEIHARHGLPPNPLYLGQSERVGCWPCIFSRKAEIRAVANVTPERIEFIRQLEVEATESATARYAARGETFESLGYHPPTFFHPSGTAGKGGMWPIDDVVSWSRTSWGGKQIELFQAPWGEQGCVRWGLCDTVGEGR